MTTCQIKIKQLVTINCINGEGLSKSYELSNGIEANEYFPKTQGSAFYILTLSKNILDYDKANQAYSSIKQVLLQLAHVWPFACGFRLGLEEVEYIRNLSPDVETNFSEIKSENLSSATSNIGLSFESVASYPYAPLVNAVILLREVYNNEDLELILKYYYETFIDKKTWFIDLYKIRDMLQSKRLFGNAKFAKTELNISNKDWKDFGKILNSYDLRHASNPKNKQIHLPLKDIEKVKSIGRKFIQNYLCYLGLSSYIFKIKG